MRTEAVILDLDGTLVDHAGAVRAALAAWLPSLGCVPGPAVEAAWFAAEDRHVRAFWSGEIGFAEQRRRRLREVLPLVQGLPDAELDALYAGYVGHYESAWTAYPDARSALAQLAGLGLRTAVLTNGATRQQNVKLAAVGLATLVGPVCTAEDLGVAKPAPAAYRTVCDRLGAAPARTVHVGDNHDLDVLAARRAGLRAIHLDRCDAGPYDEPHRITSLDELVTRIT